MTNNTAPLPADELRQQILKALKRDWLIRLQANHPIDTVETLDPVANDFAESQLVEYEQQALEDAERRGWDNCLLSLRGAKLRLNEKEFKVYLDKSL